MSESAAMRAQERYAKDAAPGTIEAHIDRRGTARSR